MDSYVCSVGTLNPTIKEVSCVLYIRMSITCPALHGVSHMIRDRLILAFIRDS